MIYERLNFFQTDSYTVERVLTLHHNYIARFFAAVLIFQIDEVVP